MTSCVHLNIQVKGTKVRKLSYEFYNELKWLILQSSKSCVYSVHVSVLQIKIGLYFIKLKKLV